MKKEWWLYLILIGLLVAHNQYASIKTKQIIQSMSENEIYETESIGWGGQKSEQWIQFQFLQRIAKSSELVEYTNHPNPNIRCYALKALANKNYSGIYEIVLDHLNDMEKVTVFQGCLMIPYSVRTFYIEQSWIVLSEEEKRTIDELNEEQSEFLNTSN